LLAKHIRLGEIDLHHETSESIEVSSQSLAVVNVKKRGRLTEFSFCGETSPHAVYALAAKTEFCKPDPSTRNAGT
jgi:hypothetical protein